ncbi:MAG: hypothetical protein ABL900_12995 [Burkholderiaceae bacterium]
MHHTSGHGYLLGRPVEGARNRLRAATQYAALVEQAQPGDGGCWQASLRGQVFLGDEAFVHRMQGLAEQTGLSVTHVSRLIAAAEGLFR